MFAECKIFAQNTRLSTSSNASGNAFLKLALMTAIIGIHKNAFVSVTLRNVKRIICGTPTNVSAFAREFLSSK